MEGFTKLPKMQHFKEGGSVQKQIANYEKRERKVEEKEDLNQDKAIVKKAIRMHDVQEHGGEKTNLSKLRKGGRAKKDCGTVKKYKTGGSVTNVYEAKKSSGDLDNIKKTKDIVPAKAAASSKAAVKPVFLGSDVAKEKSKPSGHKDSYIKSKQSGKAAAAPSGAKGPDAFCGGGKAMKKYADGGLVDAIKAGATKLKENILGTPEQNRIAQENLDKQATKGSRLAGALGGNAQAPSAPVNQSSGAFNKKRGGKVC